MPGFKQKQKEHIWSTPQDLQIALLLYHCVNILAIHFIFPSNCLCYKITWTAVYYTSWVGPPFGKESLRLVFLFFSSLIVFLKYVCNNIRHVISKSFGFLRFFVVFLGSFWLFDAFVSGLSPFELTTFANDLASWRGEAVTNERVQNVDLGRAYTPHIY